ncbi:protein of unknown function [Desulfocicer vacuolatum DSM 3385]|uniref:DUF4390 domain-containing protein n=1 Tax=Desulfocicer vacuolatum DSM 3385 TaxID=1121400 RepID=A0A1W1ZTN1_9BACT|nr:DUF4390 domain-containing protein [Desulfocicer vacuolatum]SMC51727.1 protein of unknown function [Desulfocicer vacuolatum DSM 3385]
MIQKTNYRHIFLIVMTCIGLLFFCSTTVMAKKAFLDNVTVTNTRDNLLTYFSVQNAFTTKIKEAILNGVPTTFTFHISLYRARESWFDKKISSHKVSSTIKYNALREIFSLSRPWESKDTLLVKSFDTAKKKMTAITGFTIAPMGQLIRGKKYQVRIKAEMKKIKLPLYLHHVFFFLSLWNFETDWYTMDFIY